MLLGSAAYGVCAGRGVVCRVRGSAVLCVRTSCRATLFGVSQRHLDDNSCCTPNMKSLANIMIYNATHISQFGSENQAIDKVMNVKQQLTKW